MNYETLIRAAIKEIVADPFRSAARGVAGLPATFEYELSRARTRVPLRQRIRKPWHKIVYRERSNGLVEILAVIGLSYPSDEAAREAEP
jgi:hypothetical protein